MSARRHCITPNCPRPVVARAPGGWCCHLCAPALQLPAEVGRLLNRLLAQRQATPT